MTVIKRAEIEPFAQLAGPDSLRVMREIAQDLGHLAALERVLHGPEADRLRDSAVDGRSWPLPYGLSTDSPHNIAIGRAVKQALVEPLRAVIMDPQLPLLENPFHPYFLVMSSLGKTAYTQKHARSVAPRDVSIPVLIAMCRTTLAVIDHQIRIVPSQTSTTGLTWNNPVASWEERALGFQRMGDGTPKPNTLAPWDSSFAEVQRPGMVETIAYEVALHGWTSDLASHLFGTEWIKACQCLAILPDLATSLATPPASKQVTYPDGSSLPRLLSANGLARGQLRPIKGRDIRGAAFEALRDRDVEQAAIATIALVYLYPNAVSDRSLHIAESLLGRIDISGVATALTDGTYADAKPAGTRRRKQPDEGTKETPTLESKQEPTISVYVGRELT